MDRDLPSEDFEARSTDWDEMGSAEAKGKGGSGTTQGRTVSFKQDSSDEDLAPSEEVNPGEDTSQHHERLYPEDGRRLLQERQHQQVHPVPLPQKRLNKNFQHSGPTSWQ